MVVTQTLPMRKLCCQRFAGVDGHCQKCRGHSHKNELPEFPLPKWFEVQLRLRARKAGQTQSTFISAHRLLSNFMIAISRLETSGKCRAQFREALPGALAGRVVRQA